MHHDPEKTPDHVATIAIVEDDVKNRRGWVEILEQWPEYRVTGEFGSGEEAIEALPRNPPDFVLMDINLPGISGIECTRELKRLLPDTDVLILTMFGEWDRIFDALRAGAAGYLLKRMRPGGLKAALEELKTGGAPMTPAIARKVVKYFRNIRAGGIPLEEPQRPREAQERRETARTADWVMDCLSPKENDVLKLLSEGKSYAEIAGKMEISLNTVRTYIRRIYGKLEVQSRTAAVIKYRFAEEK
jgi:RNA polymerase sigma factor (sigma-70 family)